MSDDLPVVFRRREDLAEHDKRVEEAVLRRFAAYLSTKAANFRHAAMSESEVQWGAGMANAAIDAELFAGGLEMPVCERIPFPGEEAGR